MTKINPLYKFAAVVAGAALLLICTVPYLPQAHAASYPVGGVQYYLAGAGISSTATTIQLTSFKTADGRNITMSMFGAIGYAAIDPQTTVKLENISFTGVTQNANGTTLLTGVTRGLDFVTPYTATASLGVAHSGGATFILTNTASYYGSQFAFVNNPNTFTDYNTFPTPIANSNPATKAYVDNLVNGGTITSTAVIAPGVAGETVAAGNLLYLNTSDARWYKAATTITASTADAETAISQGAGTAGNAITGGVLLKGLDTNQTGLTAGANYFTSSVAGSISSATSSRAVGKARTTTSIYFDPYFTGYALTNGASTFTATSTYSATSTLIVGSFQAWQIGKQRQVFSTVGTTTFSVPQGISKVFVEVQGGGGGGGGSNSSSLAGGGGGGGGYSNEVVDVTGTSTVQVHVGGGGTGATNSPTAGTAADWSTFGTNGTYLSAAGGSGGGSSASDTGGIPGVGSGGDINATGDAGWPGHIAASDIGGGHGGRSFYGGGGNGNSGAGYVYGGGGAGAGAASAAGGDGAQGIVIVRW